MQKALHVVRTRQFVHRPDRQPLRRRLRSGHDQLGRDATSIRRKSRGASRPSPSRSWLRPGQVEARETLPSFHYQPAAGELAAGALQLSLAQDGAGVMPWASSPATTGPWCPAG